MNLTRKILECDDEIAKFGCDIYETGKFTIITSDQTKDAWNVNQARKLNPSDEEDMTSIVKGIEHHMSTQQRRFCIHTDFRNENVRNSKMKELGYNFIPLLIQVFSGEKMSFTLSSAFRILRVDYNDDYSVKMYLSGISDMHFNSSGNSHFLREMSKLGLHKIRSTKEGIRYSVYICVCDNSSVGQIEVTSCEKVTSLSNIFVSRKYRGRGLATSLICNAINDSIDEGNESIYLTTYAFDTPRYAYMKLGFFDLMEKSVWLKDYEKLKEFEI